MRDRDTGVDTVSNLVVPVAIRNDPFKSAPAVGWAQRAVVLRRLGEQVKSTLSPLSDQWLGPAYFESIAFDR